MKMTVFWDVAPCILADVERMIMEAVSTSEWSANFYKTIRSNTPEGRHLHSYGYMYLVVDVIQFEQRFDVNINFYMDSKYQISNAFQQNSFIKMLHTHMQKALGDEHNNLHLSPNTSWAIR
jgi:hypothetical protein